MKLAVVVLQGGDRLEELTAGAQKRRERREAMAAEAEARLEVECTFRPRLCMRPPTAAAGGQENRNPEVRQRHLVQELQLGTAAIDASGRPSAATMAHSSDSDSAMTA